MCHIIRDRDGIGDAAAGEGEALLILQVWMVFDLAELQGMHAAIEEADAASDGTSAAVTGP